jgi:hypothetical protein
MTDQPGIESPGASGSISPPLGRNAVGTTSFVLGVITVVFAFLPFLDRLAFLTGLAGMITSLVSLIRRPDSPRFARTGIAFSIVGLIISSFTVFLWIV